MRIFKVGSKSEPAKLAGAIANTVLEGSDVRLECIGAGAVNNAMKGVATARGFLAPSGMDLYIQPFFRNINIDGEDKTALILNVVVQVD